MAGSGEQDDKTGGFITESNFLTSFRTSKKEEVVSLVQSAVETRYSRNWIGSIVCTVNQIAWHAIFITLKQTVKRSTKQCSYYTFNIQLPQPS
jgi:hypothetical protein